jgi:hypothetical protein
MTYVGICLRRALSNSCLRRTQSVEGLPSLFSPHDNLITSVKSFGRELCNPKGEIEVHTRVTSIRYESTSLVQN